MKIEKLIPKIVIVDGSLMANQFGTEIADIKQKINELIEVVNTPEPEEEITMLGCPWCKEASALEYFESSSSICCVKCEVFGPSGDTKQEASLAWNSRSC